MLDAQGFLMIFGQERNLFHSDTASNLVESCGTVMNPAGLT